MPEPQPLRVLIVGATGVFGSRLAKLASAERGVRLTLAARRLDAMEGLARELGVSSAQLDRDTVQAADLADFDLVIDCAGPFQQSHCRLIEAAISAGVDYCDLADGREFVRGIRRFDPAAKAAGMRVISGASSIPALSHAAIDSLTRGWRSIEKVRVGIFPGNRAPRGRSVVEAILSYVGKPMRVFRSGRWTDVPGWQLQGRVDCGCAGSRWASVCDTPEQDLLVERYRPTRSAEFVAGLELSILHLGLWLLSLPVRWGWIRSLRPAAGLLLAIARVLRPFGSDRGAMMIDVDGVDAHGSAVHAHWQLEADANRGPMVPVLAALAMMRRFRDGRAPAAGAYACAGILELREFEDDLRRLGIRTAIGTEREVVTRVNPAAVPAC